MSIIFLILKFTYFRDVESISYLIKFDREPEARALMGKYCSETKTIDFAIENVKKMLEIEREEDEKAKATGKKCAEFRTYDKEFWYALFMGQATAYCGFQGFLMFNLVFINKVLLLSLMINRTNTISRT